MYFLDRPPAFLFFTGKGGVGKTSLACATAVHLADGGKKVLLVSTDPASNVGQVLGLTIGDAVTQIDDAPGLAALEIDPQAAAQRYRDRIVGPVRGVLPDDVLKSIEEQLSGACTTEIAAFDEFTALLTDPTVVGAYDHIVFDTAPTGHTIRLLQLPGAWSGFLESGKGDASCLGPLAGLEKQRSSYKAAVDALADPTRTRLILVARAQISSLREASRTHEELAVIGLTQQYLVINGVLSLAGAESDALASAIERRERRALAEMPDALRALPTDVIPLKPFNLVGLPPLRHLFDRAPVKAELADVHGGKPQAPHLAYLVDNMARDRHGLIMLMGKGGVGKTTLAAAIAVELAKRGHAVHLATSDPAAHLSETLAGSLPGMTVSRIDPLAETERYRQQVLATKGQDMDEAGRAFLEEDLRSPCTEEIAVFQAFSRIIAEAAEKFVVMDMAPTGHTLLLLDATGAYHHEVARQMKNRDAGFSTPMMQLQDARQTKVLIVTLAEPTPVLEASNLQDDLRRAGIEPWAWIINNSLALAGPSAPLLRQRAAGELPHIEAIAAQYARRWIAYKCSQNTKSTEAWAHFVAEFTPFSQSPKEVWLSLLLQRYILALLSEACLTEIGYKAFKFDQTKQLELELHAEYEKEIRLLDVQFLDQMIISVAAYQDQTANELAAMKDNIINPLIKEQFQLLHLMSEQIINERLDIEDINARIQAFDVKKREIAATMLLQPAPQQEPPGSIASTSLREEVSRLHDLGVHPLHAVRAMLHSSEGELITDTKKCADIWLGINDLLDRDDIENSLRSQLVAIREELGSAIAKTGTEPKAFVTEYRERTRQINEMRFLQSYKLRDEAGIPQLEAVSNMLAEIEHERANNPGSLAQDISDETLAKLYNLRDNWDDPSEFK